MMTTINPGSEVLGKWSVLIQAAKNYWIDSLPTGMTDDEFDTLEKRAIVEDKFYVRDYVLTTYLTGTRTQNRYIEKIKKFKVEPGHTMLEAMKLSASELGIPYNELYCDLKYDGSSIAIYLDPTNGKPLRIVTVGNLNIDNFGVDQTVKLIDLIPKKFPIGIKAIQCEALLNLEHLGGINPDTARQKANGLINSKYRSDEVSDLLTLRAYRYYSDYPLGDYRAVLRSLGVVQNPLDGHITFAPAQVLTLQELIDYGQDYTETDQTRTDTGVFLNDGWVLYSSAGKCIRALKYPGAGSGTEAITTTVRAIQWNNQSVKGKDSWSANVIVDPIQVRGYTIKKPSAGSVKKLITKNITPGSVVTIILANSTIPMVGDVKKPGNGDYMWPTCSCGYRMSQSDVYGSLLKCGNPMCSDRLGRMRSTIGPDGSFDLDRLLVIDRFSFGSCQVDYDYIKRLVGTNGKDEYKAYLESFLKSDLQKKNFNLVWEASWTVLREIVS